MNRKEIDSFFESQMPFIMEDLRRLIAIPSVSSDKENVGKALDFVLSVGKRLGFRAESHLDHQVGVIELGEGDETVGILTHIDVVPQGDEELWKTPPFEMREIDGKLFGRGTLDDKGATLVSLYAMKAIVDSGQPLKKRVQLIIGTQEEVEWVDMEAYVKKFPLPDYGFTPDGEFPLCNIEKGIADVLIRFPIANENSDGKAVTFIEGGTALNAVPGKCTYKVGYFVKGLEMSAQNFQVKGKTVHSCQPERGVNAILLAVKEILEEDLRENTFYKVCNFIEEYFSSMYGEKLDLYSDNEYYNGEFVHRNVFSPTVLNTTNDYIELGINCRLAFGTDEKKVVEIIEKKSRGYGGKVVYSHTMPAVYISKERPFMKEFAKAYEEITGEENEFVLAYGGSYAKAMPNIVSWGPIFLGEEDTCHEENEYILKDSLIKNGKIFALALSKIVFNEKSYK